MNRICRVFVLCLAAGCGSQDGAGAVHVEKVVWNDVASRARVNGAEVADFDGARLVDRDRIEAALQGTQAPASAAWSWIDGNGTIHAFAGTRGGGTASAATGDLVADKFSDAKVAAGAVPECHHADFRLEVAPSVAIDFTLQANAIAGERSHRVQVELEIEPEAAADGCEGYAAWSVAPVRRIQIEAILRKSTDRDPRGKVVDGIYRDVVVKIDGAAQAGADAYFEHDGRIFFSETLRSKWRLALQGSHKHFLKLARMSLRTRAKILLDSRQPGAPGDRVTCAVGIDVLHFVVKDVDENLGADRGRGVRGTIKW